MTAPTNIKTAREGINRLADLFPNSHMLGDWLKITWKDIVILVGTAGGVDDEEMGPEDLIVDIFPVDTFNETTDRRDYVHVFLAPHLAVELCDGITEDGIDGMDHAMWAMQSAVTHFHAEVMWAV